jgi:hypothetical protein
VKKKKLLNEQKKNERNVSEKWLRINRKITDQQVCIIETLMTVDMNRS